MKLKDFVSANGSGVDVWSAGYGWLYYATPVIWAIVIGVIIWLVVWLVLRSRKDFSGDKQGYSTPEDVLAKRYANGEISEEEFHYRSQFLRGHGVGKGRF